MNDTHTEFEELTIGSVAGLQAFLRNAQEQYAIGQTKEADAVAMQNFVFGDSLHAAFQSLRSTVNELLTAVQGGDAVSVGDAARLQRQYDELVRVVNTKVGEQTQIVQRKQERSQQKAQPRPQPQSSPAPKPVQKEIEVRKDTFKPKTGQLSVASDEIEVQDARGQVTVSDQSIAIQPNAEELQPKKKKRRRKKKKKPKSSETQGTTEVQHADKVRPIVQRARQQLRTLQSAYAEPNMVQQMLLEEAHEGIEQLEILAKKQSVTKEQLLSVSEVASHINRALKSVSEAAIVEVEERSVGSEVKNEVPVITEQAQETLSETSDTDVTEGVSFVPSSITTNQSRPVSRPVPKSLKTLPKPASIHEPESLTEKYLTSSQHRHFIATHYSSAKGFERLIDATITKIEAETIDQIEKWLGDLPSSAFAYIKDTSVSEVLAFADRSYEAVAADLERENIKYETFAEWRDLLDEMLKIVPQGEQMLYGELFAHFMITLAMDGVE